MGLPQTVPKQQTSPGTAQPQILQEIFQTMLTSSGVAISFYVQYLALKQIYKTYPPQKEPLSKFQGKKI